MERDSGNDIDPASALLEQKLCRLAAGERRRAELASQLAAIEASLFTVAGRVFRRIFRARKG
jgi:hypothetical protein